MNGPSNGRYRRRFEDPRLRPSNQHTGWPVEETRRRVEELGRFVDDIQCEFDGDVVAEAWAVLHPPRRERSWSPGE